MAIAPVAAAMMTVRFMGGASVGATGLVAVDTLGLGAAVCRTLVLVPNHRWQRGQKHVERPPLTTRTIVAVPHVTHR